MTITSIPLFRPTWENFAKLVEFWLLCLMVSSLVMSKLFLLLLCLVEHFIEERREAPSCPKLCVSNTRKYDHITPAMKELDHEWVPIKDLLLYRGTNMTYKCIHGMAPHYLTSKFCNRASIHVRKTLNCDQLQIPLYTSAAGQRSFKFKGAKIWNSLDMIWKNVNRERTLN